MKRFMMPEALWNAVTTSSAGTSAKLASGLMIGIATVARPDEDGIRNDSGRNSRNITIGEAGLADVAERLLGPVQDGVGDLPVVHDHGDAAGDADDEGDAEQVAGAVDERRRQVRPRTSGR